MKFFSFDKLLLVVFFSSLSFVAYSQKGDPNLDSRDSHYITISLSGGTSGFAMMPGYKGILVEDANFTDDSRPIVLHPDSLNITPFLGGSFGFGYEYQTARGFWFSIGLEAQILSGGLHHTDSIHRIESVMDGDRRPEPADVEYTVINWQERQTNAYVTMPIMLGYKHESGMYFGVGAKLGYSLYNKIDGDFGFADCNLYYEGKEPIMGIYKELPLTDVQSRDENFMNLLQVNPMVEIGWQGLDMQVSKQSRMRFKFALVGELGMLSAYNNKNSAEQLFNYESLDGFTPEDLPEFFKSVNSFYSTMPLGISSGTFNQLKGSGSFVNFAKPTSLRSWFVGVKFGIMFEMPKRKPCNCLQNNVITPWDKKRKDRGVE